MQNTSSILESVVNKWNYFIARKSTAAMNREGTWMQAESGL
jgi:hypothetical protein